MSTDSPFSDITDLGVVNETALENGDPCFTQEQLDQYDHTLIRRLAAQANTDEINGRSTSMQMKTYFRCQRSLSEFADQ